MNPASRPARKLRTRIAQASWCDPPAGYAFQPATLSIARDRERTVSWLDELFEGGIVLPATHGENRALTIVVTGPAGSGKSTLALEMSYWWALHETLTTAFVLTEAHAPWVLDNIRSLGWEHGSTVFRSVDDPDPDADTRAPRVFLTDDEKALPRLLHPSLVDGVLEFCNQQRVGGAQKTLGIVPDVVAIDSLNTIDSRKRAEVYEKLGKLMMPGVKVVLLLGDSSARGPLTEPWEFAADMVLRLDVAYDAGGYLVRTIEIVKARYQSHVWGKHQLKLYGKPDGAPPRDIRMKLRSHPYIKQGGVFIYPSIHYVLSRYKTTSPITHDEQDYVRSPLEELTALLGGKGFPKGRCTALVGDRGTHKSHLGYLQLLSAVLKPDHATSKPAHHKALIVSLRDDEGTTRTTLSKIVRELHVLGDEWTLESGKRTIDELEAKGDLEITFYPPGFITPEEFFHRLLLSINRLKVGADVHLSVLFNSLDQLSSRFPLCAQHKIFVPGIIQMLTAEDITSYFVAAKEQENIGDYGLLSMAELIVTAERREMSKLDYLSYLDSLGGRDEAGRSLQYRQWIDRLDDVVWPVYLQIDRFAGGDPAGAHGILELFQEDRDDPATPATFFRRSGLQFIRSTSRVKAGLYAST